MANKTLNTRLQIRNDTKVNWNTNNPILLKGELGIEIDSRKFKVGDGVQAWNALSYASAQSAVSFTRTPTSTDDIYDLGTLWINTAAEPRKAYVLLDNTAANAVWKQLVSTDDLSAMGAGDMLKADFATSPKSEQGYVDKATVADKLTSGSTITITGDVEALGVNFDGSTPITLTTALQTIMTAGTYVKLTVNEKGLVTGFATLDVNDIPDLLLSKITDAGTAASKNVGVAAGNVIMVEPDGKISSSLIPSIAITDVWTVGTEAEMLALVAQSGDIAIRTDMNKTFILKAEPASSWANWVELLVPTGGVISVNGMTGTVILSTTNIEEGTNLYFTEERATANFNTNYESKSSSDLIDGDTLIHSTDTIILNGGTSSI